ncbi:hypothetical protein [Breoghania sp. JC706]|uniref:hypothetical protein n=1 Tax=Breoghania sp. JC706 TaxID=3117732 RepID=UPI003009D0D4
MTTLSYISGVIAVLVCFLVVAYAQLSTFHRHRSLPGWRAIDARSLPQSKMEI